MRPDQPRVRAFLASRPSRVRVALETYELYWVQGLTGAQLAARIGITTRAAEQRVRRLRRAAERWSRR